jgi:streptogramin lyase
LIKFGVLTAQGDNMPRIFLSSKFLFLLPFTFLSTFPSPMLAAGFEGQVLSTDKSPVVGAMVTARFGSPFQERTVFTDEEGRYQIGGLSGKTDHKFRVRRIGWHDIREQHESAAGQENAVINFNMTRHTDAAEVAAQLPANHWYALVLEQIDDEYEREQLVRQCTYCHQQGSEATRVYRNPEEWHKVLALMARMGGGLDMDFRKKIPDLFNTAYDPKTAVPRLTEGFQDPGFSPPPNEIVRRSVIDEYELGGRSSMQHDMIVHTDGTIYSVDMTTDTLFHLDPAVEGGARETFHIPSNDLPLGGNLASGALPSNTDMRVGPHSLQVGEDGALWITLAVGNKLARFDVDEKNFTIEELPEGIYPHTLRIDGKGRIWYTIAVSNHVGMFDPRTGQHEIIRVPARSFGEEVVLRLLPTVIWLSQYIDMDLGGGEGSSLPVPYGIDFAPDGGVWFSQLNAHRIGHIDPDTFEITMIDTPFTAPRRMRFDSKGKLWIPGFSSNLISRYDIDSGEFEHFEIPVEPLGTETPYALNVDLSTDDVWICGTNSDSLIRFQQASEEFTIYPLPTRVTYTRDIDFAADGSVWTSNSNAPAWQIETGVPRVIHLDVNGSMKVPLVSSAR